MALKRTIKAEQRAVLNSGIRSVEFAWGSRKNQQGFVYVSVDGKRILSTRMGAEKFKALWEVGDVPDDIRKAVLEAVKRVDKARNAASAQSITIELPPDDAAWLKALAVARAVDVFTLARLARSAISFAGIKFYDLDTVVKFGKYSGETMETIIRCDPSYVSWCQENVSDFALSEGALELFDSIVDAAVEAAA